MKKTMKKLLLVGSIAFSANAFAGSAGDKGNGGGSHYCPNRTHQEMYDLYEAKKRYHFDVLTEENEPNTVDGYLDFALDRLQKIAPTLEELARQELERTVRITKTVPSVQIEKIADATITMVDKGCRYEQMANWDEMSGFINVDEDIFKAYSNLHKAAFYLHETLYKIARTKNKEQNSDRVRRTVGFLFAKDDIGIESNGNLTAESVPDEEGGKYAVNLSQYGKFDKYVVSSSIDMDPYQNVDAELKNTNKKTNKRRYKELKVMQQLSAMSCMMFAGLKRIGGMQYDPSTKAGKKYFSQVTFDAKNEKNRFLLSCAGTLEDVSVPIELEFKINAYSIYGLDFDPKTYTVKLSVHQGEGSYDPKLSYVLTSILLEIN